MTFGYCFWLIGLCWIHRLQTNHHSCVAVVVVVVFAAIAIAIAVVAVMTKSLCPLQLTIALERHGLAVTEMAVSGLVRA